MEGRDQGLDLVVEVIAVKASPPRWLAATQHRGKNAKKKKKRQHNTGEDSIA